MPQQPLSRRYPNYQKGSSRGVNFVMVHTHLGAIGIAVLFSFSRGSILTALSKVTTFDGNHIITPTNPAAKTMSNCHLIAQVVNGQFQRVDYPPANSSTNGYRCDYQYTTRPIS